jgi:hypothetical protein
VDLHSAGSPTSMVAGDETDEVTQIPRFLDVEVIARLRCLEPVTEPLSDRLAALECSALKEGVGVHDEDHIFRVVVHCTREVALVHSCELVAHNFDVLPRHRPRSISRQGGAAGAGLRLRMALSEAPRGVESGYRLRPVTPHPRGGPDASRGCVPPGGASSGRLAREQGAPAAEGATRSERFEASRASLTSWALCVAPPSPRSALAPPWQRIREAGDPDDGVAQQPGDGRTLPAGGAPVSQRARHFRAYSRSPAASRASARSR